MNAAMKNMFFRKIARQEWYEKMPRLFILKMTPKCPGMFHVKHAIPYLG